MESKETIIGSQEIGCEEIDLGLFVKEEYDGI